MSGEDISPVHRRSKRSTAGNRMEAALAEMTIVGELSNDFEDDFDFVIEQDEEDDFESDFESTDEEAETEARQEAEIDEDKRARKASHNQTDRTVAAAYGRQRVSFNPELYHPPEQSNKSNRNTHRNPLSTEGQEVIQGEKRQSKRKSKRRHTIQNTNDTANRMRSLEKKRASTFTKRTKPAIRMPNQDELIAQALDNEEGNVEEHRNFLKIEDEKRKRVRSVRNTISAPLLRWISRTEEVEIYEHCQAAYSSFTTSTPTSTVPAAASGASDDPSLAQTPNGQSKSERKETRNYLIHEMAQDHQARSSSWGELMKVVFGDHAKWEDLKVLSGRNRPLSRLRPMCLISGRPAIYLDPKTGIPFANVDAYKSLNEFLAHEYVWNAESACYVAHEPSNHSP